MQDEKYMILIVDDEEENRKLLVEILGEEYDLVEAKGGQEAIDILDERSGEIDIVLLHESMPDVDGFDVLTAMNNKMLIQNIPVIMLSIESTSYNMRRAFGLGVADYIIAPFDSVIVKRRVINTLSLYSKQKRLISILVRQIYQREKNANVMANILGHIVEFRNGDDCSHVLNVGVITKILLEYLNETSKYKFTYDEILLISTAATLHDIGKISIPEEIAYKSGSLSKEEFEMMKTHSTAGKFILDEIKSFAEEEIVKIAKDICLSHHERYDGNGYPNGLVGDEIPITAQVVGLADAYDVLTSERVYKTAFDHDTAVKMILNGECGMFNPVLIEAFKDVSDKIREELKANPVDRNVDLEIRRTLEEFLKEEEIDGIVRSMDMFKEN
ncbi:MAG: response regulator [Lachnospiraceae bacterium]|nr:response regulator [Lachnospiraceae bacterium]